MNENEKPITHADLNSALTTAQEHIISAVQRLITDSEARMREHVHDSETRILTEFHKWASPTESRVRTHAAHLRTLELEIEALSDRVKQLEERKAS